MHFLYYSSAIIAALSLVLIAIFVIIAVKSAKQTMKDISETLDRLETKLNGITEKSDQLMVRSNQIAEDVEDKVKQLDGIAQSAKTLGKSTEYLNESFLTLSKEVQAPDPKYMDIVKKATALTEIASVIYNRFKSEKRKSQPYDLKKLPYNGQEMD